MERIRKRWRAWLRALHRDTGYLLVGLTFVYAASGIAINHIADWDPNFESTQRTHQIALPLPKSEAAAAQAVLASVGIDREPVDAYLATDTQLEIELGNNHFLHVDLRSGIAHEELQEHGSFSAWPTGCTTTGVRQPGPTSRMVTRACFCCWRAPGCSCSKGARV